MQESAQIDLAAGETLRTIHGGCAAAPLTSERREA